MNVRHMHTYLQEEDSGSDLEKALSGLHDSIIKTSPSLLPLFKKVFNAVHSDRAKSIQQRAAILGLGGVSPTPLEKQQKIQNTTSTRLMEGIKFNVKNGDFTAINNLSNFNTLNNSMTRVNYKYNPNPDMFR